MVRAKPSGRQSCGGRPVGTSSRPDEWSGTRFMDVKGRGAGRAVRRDDVGHRTGTEAAGGGAAAFRAGKAVLRYAWGCGGPVDGAVGVRAPLVVHRQTCYQLVSNVPENIMAAVRRRVPGPYNRDSRGGL
ncbi:hypothetical protein GCM10010193_06470 [Kitasatospora atroaurantiaca]